MKRARSISLRVAAATTVLICTAAVAAPAGSAAEPGASSDAAAWTDVLGSTGAAAAPVAANGLIAYEADRRIHTIAPDGTGDQVLTGATAYAPTWSPDGTRIAYVFEVGGVRDLWVMNADGSGKAAVTTGGGVAKGGAAWSPDGKWLAFGLCTRADGRCNAHYQGTFLSYISSAARSARPTVVNDKDESRPFPGIKIVFDRVAWWPGGDHVVFGSNSFPSLPDTYLLDYEISSGWLNPIEAIGFGGLEGDLGEPAFNADGTLLAYDEFVDVQGDVTHRGITICDYPVTSCEGNFRDVARDTQLTFAPAGERVALVRDRRGGVIVLADLDGTHRVPLTRGIRPSWQSVPAL